MKQVFTLSAEARSEAELLALLRKMADENTLSIIVGEVGSGVIAGGGWPVSWTYKAAQPEAVPEVRKLYRVDIHTTDDDFDAMALLTTIEAEQIDDKLDDMFRTQREDSISGQGVEIDATQVPFDYSALVNWLDVVAADIEPSHDKDGNPLED